MDEGLRDSKHADDSGGVVAGAGSGEAVGSIVAGDDRIERRCGGEDSVEMRGEDDDGAGAVRREIGCRNESHYVAEGVGADVDEADLGEACGNPLRAGLFSERWCGNGDQLGLAGR